MENKIFFIQWNICIYEVMFVVLSMDDVKKRYLTYKKYKTA